MKILITAIVYFLLAQSIVLPAQINLDHTDSSCDPTYQLTWQRDCFHVSVSRRTVDDPKQTITFCLGECPPLQVSSSSPDDPSFTFEELAKKQITSEQLFSWSASTETSENYQRYLNQLTSFQSKELVEERFYNCTWPRFGTWCQYSFDHHLLPNSSSSLLSLDELVSDFYNDYPYNPSEFTCYTQLRCDRGPHPICLDWTEICDGRIDCVDGGQDEENCWQLEMNACGEDEFRCISGQCIQKTLFRDNPGSPDCVDASDEYWYPNTRRDSFYYYEAPTIMTEDVTCSSYQMMNFNFPLTSSCNSWRQYLIAKIIFTIQPTSITDDCWKLFKCLTIPNFLPMNDCPDDFFDADPIKRLNETCSSSLLLIPSVSVLVGQVHYLYGFTAIDSYRPTHICFNPTVCPEFTSATILLPSTNLTCQSIENLLDLTTIPGRLSMVSMYLLPVYQQMKRCHSENKVPIDYCDRSNMYRCHNSSKCISIHRLHDGIIDCFYQDDENLPAFNLSYVAKYLSKHFFCPITHQYINIHRVNDENCDCLDKLSGQCEDEFSTSIHGNTKMIFSILCDGATELSPVLIENRSMTDESDCEFWKCNNTYARCDGFWNCFDGSDEADCESSPLIPCPPHHHICWSIQINQPTCLPISRANDGTIDCVGGLDEPNLCRERDFETTRDRFYCLTNDGKNCIDSYRLCDGRADCLNGDDEFFCRNIRDLQQDSVELCQLGDPAIRSPLEDYFCSRFKDLVKPTNLHFLLEAQRYPETEMQLTEENELTPLRISRFLTSGWECHRGIPIRVNHAQWICVCPPTYYGPHCQFQNQRISLTLQFRALSDSWQTLFAVIVQLIDDTEPQIIQSSDQFTYLPMRDCQIKFNTYLLYATRPRNESTTYFLQIDLYNKLDFSYRSTWRFPVQFPFLPVHRLSFRLDIPPENINDSYQRSNQLGCSHPCIHGQCTRTIATKIPSFFCRCQPSWSGMSCNTSVSCRCSSDSMCVGQTYDGRSICLCPTNRIGPHCLIASSVCGTTNQTAPCLNNGQCIPSDRVSGQARPFICICPKGFMGDRCETRQVQLIINFDKTLDLPESMLMHFIRYYPSKAHENATAFKIIPVNEDSASIYWSHPFHIVLVELQNQQYYLAHLQKYYDPTMKLIHKTLSTSERCSSIRDLFNHTIVSAHPLYRMKFYHLPCQTTSPMLQCFYDDTHICLCTSDGYQRIANCFEFDHHKKLDCFGQNACENGARCVQDNPTCPKASMCICPSCFYGTKCQFSMDSFVLSLDAILGYHVRPQIALQNQSSLVQITIISTMIMGIIGCLNGSLSFITFKNKKTREVGCGYFLLGSSVTTLLTMILFMLKFWMFLMMQLEYITNRSILRFQCMTCDFVLRIVLNLDQWLNACVAGERAMTTLQGTNFNKAKSKRKAKQIIMLLILIMLVTTIHDPIHRRLIKDHYNEEDRIWCIVSYPFWLRTYDSAMNIIHFIIPFLMNIVSAVIIIWKNAKKRSTKSTGFQRLLSAQLRQHKHLVITPFLIVIVSLPRLIISILSGCMKSGRSAWVYVASYQITFVAPMLSFALFVLPSSVYKDQFIRSIGEYTRTVSRNVLSIWTVLHRASNNSK